MSRLECITDDMEEEIALRVKAGYLCILPLDFDHEALRSELIHDGNEASAKLMVETSTKMFKALVDYAGLVTMISLILDLDLKAAESRIKEREVPAILKKMKEEHPRIRKTEGK